MIPIINIPVLKGSTSNTSINDDNNSGLVGANAQNNLSYQMFKEAQDFNHQEAEIAYKRELEADSTKYQRAMGDLRAAGINPLMAVNGLSVGSVSAQAASSAGASNLANDNTVTSALIRGFSQILSSALKVAASAAVK